MTAPWLMTGDPNAGHGVAYGQPSILDRVVNRLFPTAQYTGLLDSGAQRDVQRQGLLSLGAGLLQAGAPQPYQPGLLGNIGGALQQSQVNFPKMAEQALQLQAYRSQIAQQQAIASVASAHPVKAGETRQEMYDRQVAMLNDLMTIPGGAAIAEKYAPVVAATKPDKLGEPMKIEGTENRLGRPGIGTPGTFLIHYPGEPSAGWDFVPKGSAGKYHVEKNTETGATYYVPDEPSGGPPVPIGLNLGGRTSSSQAALTGAESRAAAGRLLSAQVTGSQVEEAHHANAVPSTLAAIVGGVTKKLAGEEAGAGVKQALRGSLTNQYQAAAGRWVDAYMQLVPKSRSGSAELRELVLRTYWGQEGDDMANVTAKAQARKAATASLARAVATGTAPALPGFEPEPSAP